jgi:hypothetical protein
MTILCRNCGHEIDEGGLDASYRDGYEADKPVWILDQAIRCPHCEIVMGRSVSNRPQKSTDWDFQRATNLDIVKDLTDLEIEEAKAKLARYPFMTRELSSFLARRRPGDRTVRYNAVNTTALAIIRGDGVLAIFTSLVDL